MTTRQWLLVATVIGLGIVAQIPTDHTAMDRMDHAAMDNDAMDPASMGSDATIMPDQAMNMADSSTTGGAAPPAATRPAGTARVTFAISGMT